MVSEALSVVHEMVCFNRRTPRPRLSSCPERGLPVVSGQLLGVRSCCFSLSQGTWIDEEGRGAWGHSLDCPISL